MAQPTQSDVHVDVPLTNMSVAYMSDLAEFQADNLAPVMPSDKQSNKYFTFTKDFWFRDGLTVRGPGGQAPRLGYGIDSSNSYSIDIWSGGKAIDDQVRANEDSPLNSDRNAMQFVTRLERIRREKSFASAFLATGKWDKDVTGNTSASAYGSDTIKQWDQATGTTPLEDIAHYRTVVKKNTGFMPNVLVLGQEAWDALKNNAEVLDRVTGGANNGNPAQVTKQLVAMLMELDEVVVMSAIENTAAQGAAFSGSFIAGKAGLLMYRDKTAALESVTACRTFTWQQYAANSNGTRILKYRDEAIHSDIIEIESAFAHKIIASDLGVFLTSLVA